VQLGCCRNATHIAEAAVHFRRDKAKLKIFLLSGVETSEARTFQTYSGAETLLSQGRLSVAMLQLPPPRPFNSLTICRFPIGLSQRSG
jgi:hypothetical protein